MLCCTAYVCSVIIKRKKEVQINFKTNSHMYFKYIFKKVVDKNNQTNTSKNEIEIRDSLLIIFSFNL